MTETKGHLLIIDDNEDILFMLKAMLRFKGYDITVRDTVEDITQLIAEIRPDAVLMDMLLSGANGCDLCRKAKETPLISGIPIIMMSAMPNADALCADACADHFIAKPFEMESMLYTVATALENTRKLTN
jgi:DNA-binding response OmpR family regulator